MITSKLYSSLKTFRTFRISSARSAYTKAGISRLNNPRNSSKVHVPRWPIRFFGDAFLIGRLAVFIFFELGFVFIPLLGVFFGLFEHICASQIDANLALSPSIEQLTAAYSLTIISWAVSPANLINAALPLTSSPFVCGARDDADIVDEFPISMINTIWFDEIYQAFHRNRGLRYQRIIFSYAWFPEPNMTMQKENGSMVPELLTRYNLRKDFPSTNDMIQLKDDATHEPSIKKVMDEEEKKKIFDTYKKQYKGGLMQTLMENIELDENSYDIADKFSINKRGNIRSRDTKPITELKKTYEKVKELVQYSEK